MNGRRIALVIPVLLTIAIPVGIARAPGRPAMPKRPLRPVLAPRPKALVAVAAQAPPTALPSENSPLPAIPPGFLRFHLTLPEGLRNPSFEGVILQSDGNIEKHFSENYIDQPELLPLAPGRKAVVLFSPKGSVETMMATVTIAEGAESSLDLRLTASVPLSGEVVDATGKPVSNVEVEIEESHSYVENFAPVFTEGVFSRGLMGMEVGDSPAGPSYLLSIRAKECALTRGFSTDARGRFRIPAGPTQASVPLKLLKERKLLKEEVILASNAPLRLVVPGVAEAPKK